MTKSGGTQVRVVLELLRIIFIMAILGTLLGNGLGRFYSWIGLHNETSNWTVMVGVYILVFVLYRNKLQFSGWYTGKGRNKLSRKVTFLCIFIAGLLLVSPVYLTPLIG